MAAIAEVNQDSSSSNPKQALIVLGMHRSGTSALTRVLSLCGASLPQKLMSPLPNDNETGFWEPDEIVAIHEELLRSAESSWHDLALFPQDWLNSRLAIEFQDRLLQALHKNFSEASLFVLKDPRICRLVPLWLEILKQFDAQPKFILPIRNPLEVAASLQRRDSFEPSHSFLIWLQHFLAAEQNTRGLLRCFVTYDQLLTDWRSLITRIESRLQISFPKSLVSIETEVDTFLRPDLRHHHQCLDDLAARSDISDWVKAAFNWAVRASHDEVADFGEIDAIWLSFREADKSYGPVLKDYENKQVELIEKNSYLSKKNQDQNVKVAQLNHELTAQKLWLEAERTAKEVHIEELLTELNIQDLQLNQLIADLERQELQINQFTDHLAFRDVQVKQLNHALKNREHAYNRLATSFVAQQTYTQRLQHILHQQTLRLDATYHSTSWKLSMPVRICGNLLRQLRSSHLKGLSRLLQPTVLFSRQTDVRKQALALIEQSGLFALDYYLACYPDVLVAGGQPLEHYFLLGGQEGRNPHPLFDSAYYLETNPDVGEAGVNPLVHYLASGAVEGRNPHPLFDSAYYLETNPDVGEVGVNPLVHYLASGAVEGRNPHPLFDSAYYLETNPDVGEAGVNPLVHYSLIGAAEGYNPHPLFDTVYYLERNPDVAVARINPLAHYFKVGALEGRDPHPLFDSSYYLEKNLDIREAGANPLVHYYNYGEQEKRDPHPLFNVSYYASEVMRSSQEEGARGRTQDNNAEVSLQAFIENDAFEDVDQTKTIYAFTSICLNYLPKAQVLARTLKVHNPNIKFCLLVAEPIPQGLTDELAIFDEVTEIGDLPIPDRTRWIFKHTIVEICTAIKGFYLYELVSRSNCEAAFYFDPDIAVFSSIDLLLDKIQTASILLTPHLTTPEEHQEAILDNEICALRHGVYNLGFLGVKASSEGLRFAQWWRDRLEQFCYDDIPQGLFTDQRWVDLAPAFFEELEIIRHPGCNVATWNFTHRQIEGSFADGFKVNGEPLIFYHFSGLDSGAQEAMLDKYGTNMVAAYELRKWYLSQTQGEQHRKLSRLTWAYSCFTNGEPICLEQRLLYRQRPDLQVAFPNPFEVVPDQPSYFNWYQTEILGRSVSSHTGLKRTAAISKSNLLCHFLQHGAFQGLCPNPYFDPKFYLTENPDVAQSGVNPLVHYLLDGATEGREPSKNFEAKFYQEQLPLHQKHLNPLTHYLVEGCFKKLRINRFYNVARDRAKTDIIRHCFSDGKPVVLMVTHGRGGGTDKHVQELIDLVADRIHCLLLTNVRGRNVLRLNLADRRLNVTLDFDPETQLIDLGEFLLEIGVQRIHIHHLFTHEAYLKDFVIQLGLPFDLTVHDYYIVSPNPHLIGLDCRFVGQDLLSHEDELMQNVLYKKEKISLQEWQVRHQWLIKRADRVIIPSVDVARRLKPYFPDLEPVLAYHYESLKFASPIHIEALPKDTPLRIAILGALNPSKGLSILVKCAQLAVRFNYSLEFMVIGTVLPEVEQDLARLGVFMTGAYADEQLQNTITELGAHLIWYPSQCPETYSYTLSAGLVSGLPLVVPDLGAFPERVSGRAWTWVQPWNLEAEAWIRFFLRIRVHHFEVAQPPTPPEIEVCCIDDFYEQGYLKPLLDEQAPREPKYIGV